MIDIDEILADDKLPAFEVENDNAVPFPQANSMTSILDAVLNTDDEGSTIQSYLAVNVVNSQRQALYYVNAAIYLGLCKKIGEVYYPTGLGLRLKKAERAKRNGLLAAMVLSHPVIGRWYSKVFMYDSFRDRLSFIETGFESQMARSTMERRSQCVLSWLAWVQKNLPEL